jgi:hypothetical protein
VIVDIRKVLKHDINSQVYYYSWNSTELWVSNFQKYIDIADLFYIQDLSSKIEDRNDYLRKNSISPILDARFRHFLSEEQQQQEYDKEYNVSNNPETKDLEQLKKYNECCLDLIEDALKKIDWAKYRSLDLPSSISSTFFYRL